MIKISKEKKNSLIKQNQRLYEFEKVELEVKDESISKITKTLNYQNQIYF